MDGSEPTPLPERVSFTTLTEARDALIDIQNSWLRFMWATMEKKYRGTIAMTEILEQVRLEMRLAEWHRAMDQFESQLVSRATSQVAQQARTAEEDSLIILRLLYYVAHIWLSSFLSLKETAFDAFISEFQQINTLSDKLLSRRRLHAASPSASYSLSPSSSFPATGGSSETLSLHAELVGPLYFTATKCRDPTTRRRTLALLGQCNQREDAINSCGTSQLATAVMQMEEAGMQLAARYGTTTSSQTSAAGPPQPPSSSNDTGSPSLSSSLRLDTATMFPSLPIAANNTSPHHRHDHAHHHHHNQPTQPPYRYQQPSQQQSQPYQHQNLHNRIAPTHVAGLPTTLRGGSADIVSDGADRAGMGPGGRGEYETHDRSTRHNDQEEGYERGQERGLVQAHGQAQVETQGQVGWQQQQYRQYQQFQQHQHAQPYQQLQQHSQHPQQQAQQHARPYPQQQHPCNPHHPHNQHWYP